MLSLRKALPVQLSAAVRHRVVHAFLSTLVAACSSENSSSSGRDGVTSDAGPDSAGDAAGPGPRERPPGPAADLTEEISGANNPFIGAATGLTVPDGYVQQEYVASGTATDYEATGALTEDGRWTLSPTTTAAYRTRVLVRRPASTADFSGTVIVEWLNVSGGIDANPDYASLEEEITRQGHAWVGVSAQLIGVEGGPVLVQAPGGMGLTGQGLKAIDPERYGSLDHPGDGYSFDIFTQVARALLEGGPALGGVKPQIVIAAGESQSAIALTTYYNGVQPLSLMFDGFLVHSRASVSLPLVGPGEYADLTGAIVSAPETLLRDDLDAPALELQAESDVVGVLNSVAVRQPDSDTFRLWEVAGTAHADAHLIGPAIAEMIDCGVPINNGPLHLVAKAAFRGLEGWVRTGEPPPTAPLLETTEGATPVIARDSDGIALGGLRTPPIDVPVDVLSGVAGPNTDLICILLGSTIPLSPERLAELYSTRADYEGQYAAESDRVVGAGFILEDDRDALLGYSQPSRVEP